LGQVGPNDFWEEWMRRHHVFAAGVSVALLLGGMSPAMAKPAKAPKAAKPPKPPKAPKPAKAPAGRVTGGGVTQAGAHFSVDARQDRLTKGHFNYESADRQFRVRCDGFDSYSPVVYITVGPPAAHVKASCVTRGPHHSRTPVSLDATFVDNGSSPKTDEANLTFTRQDGSSVSDSGAIRSGNIQVR
jgi:hypothetical protein